MKPAWDVYYEAPPGAKILSCLVGPLPDGGHGCLTVNLRYEDGHIESLHNVPSSWLNEAHDPAS